MGIPLSSFIAAHRGTSMVPDQRGRDEQAGFLEHLRYMRQWARELAEKHGTTDLVEAELERYEEGYTARYRAWLQARARCVSTMIAGPSNFPVSQQRKRHDSADNRMHDLNAWDEKARKAIAKKLNPGIRPVMTGDDDACERLADKIKKAEAEQEQMKAINAAWRRWKKNPATLDDTDLPESHKERIRNFEPEWSGDSPVPKYALSNNNANIRRMKQRLEQLRKAKATEAEEIDGENARLEIDPAANRVRLFFPGKPAAEVRAELKSRGFRWARSLGCWQAYINHRTETTARRIAGIA